MPIDMSKARPVEPFQAVLPEITGLASLERVIEGAANFSYTEMCNGSFGSFPHKAYLFDKLGLRKFPQTGPDFSESEVIEALIQFGQKAKLNFCLFHFESERDLPPEIEKELISKAIAKFDRSKPLFKLIKSWSIVRT